MEANIGLKNFLNVLKRKHLTVIAKKMKCGSSGTKDQLISKILSNLMEESSPIKVVANYLKREDLLDFLNDSIWPPVNENDEYELFYLVMPRQTRKEQIIHICDKLFSSLDNEKSLYYLMKNELSDYFISCDDYDDYEDDYEDDDDGMNEAFELESGESLDREVEAMLDSLNDFVSYSKHDTYRVEINPLYGETCEKLISQLYDYQKEAVSEINKWWSGTNNINGLVSMPTGSGKTRIAVSFFLTEVIAKHKKVLWVAHRAELIDQVINNIKESGRSIGKQFTISRYQRNPLKDPGPFGDVTVASLQTLAYNGRSGPNLNEFIDGAGSRGFDLIVLDECHRGVAPQWYKIIRKLQKKWPECRLLGLSATPTRHKFRIKDKNKEVTKLWELFDKNMIYNISVNKLINGSFLSRPKLTVVNASNGKFLASPDEKEQFRRFGDIPTGLVKRISDDEKRNKLVAHYIFENKESWGQTLLFAGSVEQAIHLESIINKKGILCKRLVSSDGLCSEERRKIINLFRNKDLKVLVNVGILTEGTDIPSIETVIIARPTRSPILMNQMIGRGMRGPRLGGTEKCDIVFFHDYISNLEDEEIFGVYNTVPEELVRNAFGEEIEYNILHESDDINVEQDEMSVQITDPYEIIRKDIENWIRNIAFHTDEPLQPPADLVGWYRLPKVEGLSEQVLFVFDQDRDMIDRAIKVVEQVIVQLPSNTAHQRTTIIERTKGFLSEGKWISLRRWEMMAYTALLHKETPTFVPLENALAQPEVMREMVLSNGIEQNTLNLKQPEINDEIVWLQRAIEISQLKQTGSEVILDVSNRIIGVLRQDYEIMKQRWDKWGSFFQTLSEMQKNDFLNNLKNELPSADENAEEDLFDIFREAARTDCFPMPFSEKEKPENYSLLRKELLLLPVEQAFEAANAAMNVYYNGQYPDLKSFIYDVVLGQNKKENTAEIRKSL